MRSVTWFAFLFVIGISRPGMRARAQAPRDPAAFSNGVDYTFERTFAKRPVLALRLGVGGSSGTFREECAFSAGKCSLAEYRALPEPGIAEALNDSNAVIDQVIEGRAVPSGSKIIFSGISRGGFLSLRIAAERPEITRGVVNFVGGWLSVNDGWPAEENAARVELQNQLFRSIGNRILRRFEAI
jgi:pimeloyl-ACP methyl ester carboxylesterase